MSLTARQPLYAIDRQFHSRWSTRAFSGEPIPDAALLTLFEAARWAPSGGNAQPWRFIYARPGTPAWETFLGFLNERNRLWASRASALVLLLSRKQREAADGSQQPLRSHAFDAGAAWSNLAHQAHLLGWSARAMGGFDLAAARAALQIPEHYDLQIVIAIGRPGDNAGLPEDLRALDLPNQRLPLEKLVSEGRFNFD